MKDIFSILKSHIPFWELLNNNHIIITPMEGGLSNKLYLATISKSALPNVIQSVSKIKNGSSMDKSQKLIIKVIIRIYGVSSQDQDKSREDRKNEKMIHKLLSSQKMAPALYHDFGEGRLEEFIEGRIATMEEMGSEHFQAKVMRRLARFHRTKGVEICRGKGFEMCVRDFLSTIRGRLAASKEIRVCCKSSQTNGIGSKAEINGSKVDKTEDDHVKKARQAILDDIAFYKNRVVSAQKINLEGCPSFPRLEEEAEWLFTEVSKLTGVVFCHNDVQRGNLLFDLSSSPHGKKAGKVRIIDFEYAGVGFRAMDLGNFFCESYLDNFSQNVETFEIDLALFPPKSKMMAAIRAYLSEGALLDGEEVPVGEDLTLYEEAKVGILCSGFNWALWALIQDADSDIEWCFHSYALARLREYFRLKSELLSGRWK